MALGGTPSHPSAPASTADPATTSTQAASDTLEPWSVQPPLILAFVAISILVFGAIVLYWSRRLRGLAWDGSAVRAHAQAVFAEAMNRRNPLPLGKRPKLWEVQIRGSRPGKSWADVRPLSARYHALRGQDGAEQALGEFGQLSTPINPATQRSRWSLVNDLYSSLSLRRPGPPAHTSCKDTLSAPDPPPPTTQDLHLLVPILMPSPPTTSDHSHPTSPPVYCLGLSNISCPNAIQEALTRSQDSEDEKDNTPPAPLPYPSMPWLSAGANPLAPVRIPRTVRPTSRSPASQTRL